MKNPIVRFFRWYALRQGRSTAPTSLLPLKKVRSATVFVDAVAMGEDPARSAAPCSSFSTTRRYP